MIFRRFTIASFSIFLCCVISCVYIRESKEVGMFLGDTYKTNADTSKILISLTTVNSNSDYVYKAKNAMSDSVLDKYPIPDSLEKFSHGKAKGLVHMYYDNFDPIKNYAFKVADTSVIKIDTVYPTLVPESNFGDMILSVKGNGITDIMVTKVGSKGSNVRKFPIQIKDKKPTAVPYLVVKTNKTKKKSIIFYWIKFKLLHL